MQAIEKAAAADADAGGTTRCVNCGRAMRHLRVPAHYGKEVGIDLCSDCHLVWFDDLESVRVDGRGVLHVLRVIHAASHQRPHEPMRAAPACPRCGMKLLRARNRTNHGPTEHHECPQRHGALQSFSLYLAEKGLVRPLYRPEYEQLRLRPEERQVFHCLNCSAPVQPREGDACRSCGAAIMVVDMQLVVRAVDRQTGVLLGAGPAASPQRRRFDCPHCGGAVDPARDRRCTHCALPFTITDLGQVLAWLEPVAPLIEAGVVNPELRRQRMAEALDRVPDLPDVETMRRNVPWWMYVAGAVVMLVLGVVLVASTRAWIRADLFANKAKQQAPAATGSTAH